MKSLNISQIIGGKIAVATSDGEDVFKAVESILNEGLNVELDFMEINILTTAFLNAAIGQLYSAEKFSSAFLNEHLKIVNVQELDIPLFSLVIQRAKEYFENQRRLEDSANAVIYG
jgi:hypothetical protein